MSNFFKLPEKYVRSLNGKTPDREEQRRMDIRKLYSNRLMKNYKIKSVAGLH